jgi:hypothetical protein
VARGDSRGMGRVRVPLASSTVRWVAVAAVAGVILAASVARPTGVEPVAGPFGLVGADKYLHGSGYAVLALAFAYALAEREAGRVAVVAFLAATVFGVGVELVQLPLAYRTFSRWDAVANATGAAVVAVCWRPLRERVRFGPTAAETGAGS